MTDRDDHPMPDLYDVAERLWCELCQAEHEDCEQADDIELRIAHDEDEDEQ